MFNSRAGPRCSRDIVWLLEEKAWRTNGPHFYLFHLHCRYNPLLSWKENYCFWSLRNSGGNGSLGLFFHSVQRGHLNSCVLHYLEARRLFHTERPWTPLEKRGHFYTLSRKSLFYFFFITKEIQKEQIFHKDKQNTRSGVFLKHARILTNTVR